MRVRYLCDFAGVCLLPATVLVKVKNGAAVELCDFHAGFMYSMDYFHVLCKPKKIKQEAKP